MSSVLGDSTILQNTTQTTREDGLVDLEYKLPSGRVVKMEAVPIDKLKGRELISWANAVREQDTYDIRERDEREQLAATARRTPDRPSPVQSARPAPASTQKTPSSEPGLPDDPSQMVKEKVATLLEVKEGLLLEEQELQHKLEENEKNLTKWKAVAESLGIDLVEEKESPKRGPRSKRKTNK